MTAAGGRPFAGEAIIGTPGQLPDTWVKLLESCVVDQNVGLPDVATLTFRDADHQFLAKTGITIGGKLTVAVRTVRDEEPLFAGDVTALELDLENTTGTFTVVRAQSPAYKLFRGRKVKAFIKMTAADIVRDVATAAGLPAGRIETRPITYQQRSQANVSDWEFLADIAQEHGLTLRVDQRTGQLDMLQPTSASGAPAPSTSSETSPYVLQYGDNLRALRAVLTNSGQVDDVEVRGWDVTTKSALVTSGPVGTSRTVVPTTRVPLPNANTKLIVADTPYRTSAETTAVSRSVAAAVTAGAGEIEAVVWGDPRLQAGVPVALGVPDSPFQGKYTATAAHHVLDRTGYRTTVLVSASPDRSLAGLAMGGNAPSRGPRMPGLAIAMVTNVKEREFLGQQRGWVKLKFPWLSDTYETDWVRTVQIGGVGGGGVFCPQVNDEVLVGFEQGSLDAPYVLGGLYNGVDHPTHHADDLVNGTSGAVQRWSLVSRSGQRLELLDVNNGHTGVHLATGNGQFDIRLDEHDRNVTIKAGNNTITLTETGITVDATTGNLTLRGATVSINGTAEVSVQAPMIRLN
jgi:phage protein D